MLGGDCESPVASPQTSSFTTEDTESAESPLISRLLQFRSWFAGVAKLGTGH
jgi:hypothetical protein